MHTSCILNPSRIVENFPTCSSGSSWQRNSSLRLLIHVHQLPAVSSKAKVPSHHYLHHAGLVDAIFLIKSPVVPMENLDRETVLCVVGKKEERGRLQLTAVRSVVLGCVWSLVLSCTTRRLTLEDTCLLYHNSKILFKKLCKHSSGFP